MTDGSRCTTPASQRHTALVLARPATVPFWPMDPFAHLPWPTFAGQVVPRGHFAEQDPTVPSTPRDRNPAAR